MQLYHAGARDLMCREGVGREDGPVDQHHVVAEAGQKQRGGRTRGARTHDDDVMAVMVGRHGEMTPDLLLVGGEVTCYALSAMRSRSAVRSNVTASRTSPGAVERRAASGRRPSASLTVENASRSATNTVIVKIFESLHPTSRSACTSAAVVAFGSRATMRAHVAMACSVVLRPSSTPPSTEAAVCASLALASLVPH